MDFLCGVYSLKLSVQTVICVANYAQFRSCLVLIISYERNAVAL